jgi:hypothetical protein
VQKRKWGREERGGRPTPARRNRRDWDWRCARLVGHYHKGWSVLEQEQRPGGPDFHSGDVDRGQSYGEGPDYHSWDLDPDERGE